MYDLGYPHYPVVDYAVGSVTDKLIFDTGNAEELVLFSQIVQDAGVQERVVSGSVRRGQGSDGVSAGGAGPVRDLLHFTLQELSVGEQALAPSRLPPATAHPPVGCRFARPIRGHLGWCDTALCLEERDTPARRLEEQATPSPEEDGTRVTQLFETSPAAGAGLQLRDRVVAIDSRPSRGQSTKRCTWPHFCLKRWTGRILWSLL